MAKIHEAADIIDRQTAIAVLKGTTAHEADIDAMCALLVATVVKRPEICPAFSEAHGRRMVRLIICLHRFPLLWPNLLVICATACGAIISRRTQSAAAEVCADVALWRYCHDDDIEEGLFMAVRVVGNAIDELLDVLFVHLEALLADAVTTVNKQTTELSLDELLVAANKLVDSLREVLPEDHGDILTVITDALHDGKMNKDDTLQLVDNLRCGNTEKLLRVSRIVVRAAVAKSKPEWFERIDDMMVDVRGRPIKLVYVAIGRLCDVADVVQLFDDNKVVMA